jgi:hypothetical protein
MDATGNFSGHTIFFDVVGPKKWGKTETIYGKAIRRNMQ